MAIVYFGAFESVAPQNGNWQDINQWYSDPGEGGKSPNTGTLLNRFPNATSDVVSIIQNVLTNVGTYVGTYPTGNWVTGTYAGNIGPCFNTYFPALADPNAIWTGGISTGGGGNTLNIQSGTFTSSMTGMYQVILNGGTFTSSFSTRNCSQITFTEPYFMYFNTGAVVGSSTTIPPLIWSSTASLACSELGIFRGITFSNNFTSQRLSVGTGYWTEQTPIITTDISTAVTGLREIEFGYVHATNNFTHPAPWIFGSSTVSIILFFLETVQPGSRPISLYMNNNAYVWFNFYKEGRVATSSLSSITYTNLNILPVNGVRGQIDQIGPGGLIYAPTVNIPVLTTSTGTKKTLNSDLWPNSWGFGAGGFLNGTFSPTVNLIVQKTLGANTE
jgi:hypothetical protein